MAEWVLLGIMAVLVWFWFDSVAKREIAIRIGQQLAARCQLQFLDESVACERLRLGRDSNGHLQIERTYYFDVSNRGVERMACQLQLRGKHLIAWHIPPYAPQ